MGRPRQSTDGRVRSQGPLTHAWRGTATRLACSRLWWWRGCPGTHRAQGVSAVARLGMSLVVGAEPRSRSCALELLSPPGTLTTTVPRCAADALARWAGGRHIEHVHCGHRDVRGAAVGAGDRLPAPVPRRVLRHRLHRPVHARPVLPGPGGCACCGGRAHGDPKDQVACESAAPSPTLCAWRTVFAIQTIETAYPANRACLVPESAQGGGPRRPLYKCTRADGWGTCLALAPHDRVRVHVDSPTLSSLISHVRPCTQQ